MLPLVSFLKVLKAIKALKAVKAVKVFLDGQRETARFTSPKRDTEKLAYAQLLREFDRHRIGEEPVESQVDGDRDEQGQRSM